MKTAISVLTLYLSLSGQFVFANDMAHMKSMTKEQRENMAGIHEKMAVCLRSEKSMQDCHDEMKQSCLDMGKDACPMMGKWHDSKMKKK